MKAVPASRAAGVPVIDLFADAPGFDPKGAAYLLAAYAPEFPAGTVFLCVVDPGVGGQRPAVIAEADGRIYVGPGNGLFEIVRNIQQASTGTQQVSASVSRTTSAAQLTGQAAGDISTASTGLSHDAEKLKSETAKFLSGIKAA
jgi:S-adenosylmethionine hydrolase